MYENILIKLAVLPTGYLYSRYNNYSVKKCNLYEFDVCTFVPIKYVGNCL